ncbi:MAG: hypothetical protein JEZ00_07730 [Anaerolineaceae bacterium]|nr:hypothetical protein [Anaerolineaceae bacterium]
MKQSLWERLTERISAPLIERKVREQLSQIETANENPQGYFPIAVADRERSAAERYDIMQQALAAWRVNPLARRMVGLTSQYVVGGGFQIDCRDEYTLAVLQSFWKHPLNRMLVRCMEWCNELTLTGNLFLLLSTDAGGMSYVRAVPASSIEEIQTRAEDCEQAIAFVPRHSLNTMDAKPWPAYDPLQDSANEHGRFQTVMLHYTVNRTVGSVWGESDLAPVLRWLARYANWLEDRARLNRYRTSFMYVVKGRYQNEAERLSRQRALNTQPPTPGSILVTGEGEEWDVLHPRLESQESAQDGLALKKMLAAGAGLPMHFLAEPESATRTTAEAAGGPTYRHYEQRQQYFGWVLGDVLRAVLRRAAAYDAAIDMNADVIIRGADISARDNLALAEAAGQIIPVLNTLREQELIDEEELLRLAYRFCGEKLEEVKGKK